MGNSQSTPAPAPAPIPPFPTADTPMPDACVRYSDEYFGSKQCVIEPETFGVCIDGIDYDGLCQACTGETVWTPSSIYRGLGKCDAPAPAPAPIPFPTPNTPMPDACVRYSDENFADRECANDPETFGVCIDGVDYDGLCQACTDGTVWTPSSTYLGAGKCGAAPPAPAPTRPEPNTPMSEACDFYTDLFARGNGCVENRELYGTCIETNGDKVDYDGICQACRDGPADDRTEWDASSVYLGQAWCDGTTYADRKPPAVQPAPPAEAPARPTPNTPMSEACDFYTNLFARGSGCVENRNVYGTCIETNGEKVDYDGICQACRDGPADDRTEWDASSVYLGNAWCDGTTFNDRFPPASANTVADVVVDFVEEEANGGDVTAVSIAALACAFVPNIL